MSVVPSVLQARNRASRYWESDGLERVVRGPLVVLMGLGGLWTSYSHGSAHVITDLYGRMLLLMFLIDAVLDKITERLKAHITYPRTGYISKPEPISWHSELPLLSSADQEELRKEKVFKRSTWALAILLMLSCFVTTYRRVFATAILCIVMLIWGRNRKSGQVLWSRLSPLPLCWFLLTLDPTDEKVSLGMSIFTIAIGVSMTITGPISLLRYLRKYPAPKS
jgi:hypothetical protein